MEDKLENNDQEQSKDDPKEEKFSYEQEQDEDKKNIKYKSYTLGKRLGIKK